jgi:hypothetical protein
MTRSNMNKNIMVTESGVWCLPETILRVENLEESDENKTYYTGRLTMPGV